MSETEEKHSAAVIDRSDRAGHIGLLMLLALGLIAAAAVIAILGRDRAEPFVLGLLGLLAVIGVFSLFATAIGFLRFYGREPGNSLAQSFVDSLAEGALITDKEGRICYANPGLCRPDPGGGNRQRAGDRAGVFRRPQRGGRHVPPVPGCPRTPGKPGGDPPAAPHWRLRQWSRRGKAPPKARAGTGSGCGRFPTSRTPKNPRPISPSGRSPISRATGRSRKTPSRNCSGSSISSTMRPPGSSHRTQKAGCSISTPRWRTGSAMIWPSSSPVRFISPTSSGAMARNSCAPCAARAGRCRPSVSISISSPKTARGWRSGFSIRCPLAATARPGKAAPSC